MTTGYFVDVARQQNWNNLIYWNAAGTPLKATYTVSPEATAVTVNMSVRIIGNSCFLGLCSGSVTWAAASIQYGTSSPVTILAARCGYQATYNYLNYQHTLTSSELQEVMNGGGIITLMVVSCSSALNTSYNLEYDLTATADVTMSTSSQGSGTLNVTITTPYGSPNTFYPATIIVTDESLNQQVASIQGTSATTQVTGLNIGDNYSIQVSMPPFADNTASTELTSETGNISVSLSCGSGKFYQANLLGQPACPYNSSVTPTWVTALEIGIVGAAVVAGIVGIAYVAGAFAPEIGAGNNAKSGIKKLFPVPKSSSS